MKMITLAADQPGAPELIAHATRQGVVVAIGHHRANAAQLDAAIAAGAKTCTHLGNGSDAVMPRFDNPIWLQLGDDRLWASFISDGQHLPAATVRCMLRAKTPDRSMLVTDAIGAAGMPPGRYPLGATEIELSPVGRVTLPGTPYLAGSSASMPLVISHAISDGGVSLVDAVKMASLNPAALLFGRAEPWPPVVGQEANLAEIEWDPSHSRLVVRQAVTGAFASARKS